MNKQDQDKSKVSEMYFEKLLDELLVLTLAIKEFALNVDGKSLHLALQEKTRKMAFLEKIAKTISISSSAKNKIQKLQYQNQANMRLLRSILRLSAEYKKILCGTTLVNGTYNHKGILESLPSASMKYNSAV